uniref:EMI domain-containing protein n=1 Tax=Glossina austeni TaxID=7395 RepID=A0A1A9VXC7_GLOAU
MLNKNIAKFLLLKFLYFYVNVNGLTVTTGHCYKNVTVTYQVAVTKTRLRINSNLSEPYFEFEDSVRMDRVRICCPGYRKIIFGLCEPVCQDMCPPNSYCAEPNKCECQRGYEQSHNHHVRSISKKPMQKLQCRPVCGGGCPAAHSYCVSRNKCACRPGYKDVSSWFSPLRCERIQCPGDQLYDLEQRKCIKVVMNLEQLMEKVGEKLADGLNELDYEVDDDSESSWQYNSKED